MLIFIKALLELNHITDRTIYGFDSFEGLPSDWVRTDVAVPEKTFAFKNPQMLPAVLHNVRLVKGMFEETLPKFKCPPPIVI